jgi:beta-galactosidase
MPLRPLLRLLSILFLLTTASVQRAFAENSRVFPVDTPIPLATPTPLSPDKLQSAGPFVVPMTGPWQFALTHGETIAESYHAATDLPKIVTASSERSWAPVTNAIDGDISTAWTAADSTLPQWLRVDLGSVRSVAGVDITFGGGRVQARYTIDGSSDGRTWSTLADRSAAPGTGDGAIDLLSAPARYVRVTVDQFTSEHRRFGGGGPAVSISELRIFVFGADGKRTEWRPAPIASDDDFATTSFNASHWDTIGVPSNWEILGYSPVTYNSVDDSVGLYRRWVAVPAAFAGKRIVWRFDGVFDGAEIFVNGVRAGYHESGYTAFDVDLTGLVKPGQRNLFAVRVCKKTPSEDLDTGDYEAMGGIFRQTYLYATPKTYVSDLTVRTSVSNDHRTATVATNVALVGRPGGRVPISVMLFDQASHWLPDPIEVAVATVGPDGTNQGHFSNVVRSPRLWSAEKPNLYYVMVVVGDPKSPIERIEQRIGVRQITISPKEVLLWNGVPIKCAGTCRHEIYPTTGAALNDLVWKRDIALMKAANINAIRTSHYNHASRFLDLCEENGFYMLDEIPFCWAGQEVGDARYKDAFLERAAETYARDKNRPEVLAWSCGNESGGGPNASAVLDYMHAQDPTRPAYISQQWPSTPGQSFLDSHYPRPDDFANMLANAAGKTPIVFTEQPHMFSGTGNLDYDYGVHDFWSVPLQRSWETVEKYPTILGSFIWEWQNQPVVSTWSDSAPNHRGKPVLVDENNKGVVDGYRDPKPEWWAVKMVYSPVQIPVRTISIEPGGIVEIPVENRYSFTNLNELWCSWTAYRDGRAINDKRLSVSCPPLGAGVLRFHVPPGTTDVKVAFQTWSNEQFHSSLLGAIAGDADILRTRGGETPEFGEVYSTRLHVAGAPLPQPPSAASFDGSLAIDDSNDALTVSNARMSIRFSKATGEIESWTQDGRQIALGGPILNLGQAHEIVNQFGRNSADGFARSDGGFTVADATVDAHPRGTHVEVTTQSSFAGADGAGQPTLKVDYDVAPNDEIAVHWTIGWTGDSVSAWEDGVEIGLPATLTKMSWLRDNVLPDYPAGSVGEPSGACTWTDLSFACSKRDLRWMALTDPSGHGLALLALDDPLLTRAHADSNSITLYASRDIAVDAELSTPWITDHDITLSKDAPVSGSFVMRAL